MFRDVEASDLGNWSRVFLVPFDSFPCGQSLRAGSSRKSGEKWGTRAGDRFELVPGADFALARHGEVEARASAGEEALHHIVHLKFDAEFVTRQPRLGHDDLRRAHRKPVADMDAVFREVPTSPKTRETRHPRTRKARVLGTPEWGTQVFMDLGIAITKING